MSGFNEYYPKQPDVYLLEEITKLMALEPELQKLTTERHFDIVNEIIDIAESYEVFCTRKRIAEENSNE